MNQDKVSEMLTNYRSYRYAAANGIAPYNADDMVGMPMGGGYGSRPPRGMLGSGSLLPSIMDYQSCSRAVKLIEGAVDDVLNDDERDVIRLKYLERNKMTLGRIADYKHMHKNTITSIHKSALKNLRTALLFAEMPTLLNLDDVIRMDKCDILVTTL